jgi:hypothetical protein
LTTGGTYTVVYTFPKLARVSALTQSPAGTLYGVVSGNTSDIFQINSAGQYKIVQSIAQGALPPTLLVVGSDSNLYGVVADGSAKPGSVFAITAQGKTIFSEQFKCTTEGCDPLSLIEASDGNFYGMTPVGGSIPSGDHSDGTIFKVATGLTVR